MELNFNKSEFQYIYHVPDNSKWIESGCTDWCGLLLEYVRILKIE